MVPMEEGKQIDIKQEKEKLCELKSRGKCYLKEYTTVYKDIQKRRKTLIIE